MAKTITLPKLPQVPVINLNGTDGHTLFAENLAAMKAIDDALDVVQQVTVHGRDYQTMPPAIATKAWGEHRDRYAALTDIRNAYRHIAERLYFQLSEREQKASRPPTLGMLTGRGIVLQIHKMLDGVEWEVGMLDRIAELLDKNGYPIRDMNEGKGA